MRPLAPPSLAPLALFAAALAATAASGANVLLVTGASTLTGDESARRTQFQAWGHTVTTIVDSDSQTNFNTAMAAADVVYIPMTVQEWELTTKVKAATKGVVCEERYLDIEMGFSTTDGWDASHTNTEVLVNSHAVTSGLATGYVTIVGSSQQLAMMNATVASGMTVLSKQNYSAGNMLGVIETGGALAGGGTAAGRRVRMPWGGDSFSWSALNANGLLIAQQAIAWAAHTNQLILHWKLDETTGTTVADSSSLGNVGTYTGSPTLGRSAPRRSGVLFTGDGVGATAPASPSLNAIGLSDADFTVAFWVKPTAPDGNWRPLFQKGSQQYERGPGLWLYPYSNTVHFRVSTSTNNNAGDDTTEIPADAWSHVTLVKQGSSCRCYINGVLNNSTILPSASTGNSGPLYVGDSPWYATAKSAMDDVRIYNYALSDAQIEEVHGLLAHWKLDESSGAIAVDGTLSKQDATLTGTQSWTTGVDGGGFRFNYTNGDDYFQAPTSTPLNDVTEGDYTVMAYVKPNSLPPGTGSANNASYAIVIKEGYNIGLHYTNQGRFQFDHYLSNYTWAGASTRNDTYSPGRWRHVAGVVSQTDGTVKIYVDGVLKNSESFTPGTAGADRGSAPWRIGIALPGFANWRWAADADIDDARIYNRALSAEEIAEYATPGLLAHWKFDEGSGTAIADSSGNGHNAAFNTGTPAWVTGVRGGALEFNGSNDARTIADFDPPAIGSVAFWFRSTVAATGTQRLLGLSGEWEVRTETSQALNFDFAGPGGGSFQTASGVAAPGVWRHVVAIYNTTTDTHKIYLDGTLVSSGAFTCADESPNELSFGTRTGSSQRFNGALDDLRIYSYELTGAEVAELYGLVGHWKFDEGAGSVVADSSGAGIHAEFDGGTPEWVEGVRGKALKFDGVSAAMTDDSFTPPATGAVAFWVRRDTAQTDQERPFGLGGDWEARQETTGIMAFDLGTSPYVGAPTFETTDAFPGVGQWRHVVAQYDSDTDEWQLYVDGQLDGGGLHLRDILPQTAERLTFGGRTGSTQRFKGTLDDFRIYNRWLQPREIADLYGLVGHWKLDETSGSVAADSSGYDRDGVFVNAQLGEPGPTGDLPFAVNFPPGSVVDISSQVKFNLRDALSIALWMKLDSISETWHPLGWEESPNYETYRFYMSDDRSWGLELNPGVSLTGAVGADSLFASGAHTGAWAHYAASYSGSEIVLYRNGVKVAQKGVSGVTVGETIASLFLGNQPAGGVEAEMADFRLYNRAFFPGEARQLYLGEWTPGLRIVKWVEVASP